MATFRIFIILSVLFLIVSQSYGADLEQRLKALEEVSKQQQKVIEDQQRLIEGLKNDLNKLQASEPEKSAAPQAAAPASVEPPLEQSKPPAISGIFGASSLLNPNLSVVLNTYGYWSNLSNSELGGRGIPGYYNNSNLTQSMASTRGFNLDSAEIYIFAPVDPYFNLYSTIPVTENGISIEEAYFTTTSLPEGLQIKGGKFRSGFGRLNPQHSHVWDFADSPLVYKAFIGNEGIDEKGVQVTYLPAISFPLTLGVEALQGENEILLGKDAQSGPHALTLFAKASVDVDDFSTILFGPSVITGKTLTDSIANNTSFKGNSTLYDFEFTYKWKPSKYEGLTLQSEYLLRDQRGSLTETDDSSVTTVSALKRRQDGFYVQGAYQFGRWVYALRYDKLGIFANDYKQDGISQSFGQNPWRLSTALYVDATEFSRLRLQYNYDHSGIDPRTNHEILLQVILGIGAHGAHTF
ncbi:hypothetical protein [Candidatus Magnetominusculus dajiuhuensis]|uniref:hypothetical protein n=1 Tax=Candidatus Magnetominusculus dajiuhuensis TaxID=3137712 RepID=UPI003B4397A7